MIGIMLLGAWFLVHQHCCVADIRSSSRNNLVDHLMRRSPLEKNFMRYGRSWPPPNFIPNSMWQLDEKMDKPEKKGKTGRDIMRFGRSNVAPLVEVSKGNEGYKHTYPLIPGIPFRLDNLRTTGTRSENNGDAYRIGVNGEYFEHLPEVTKVVHNKKNFIRFGRNSKQTPLEVDQKQFVEKTDGAFEDDGDSSDTGYGTEEENNSKRSSKYESPPPAKKQDPAFNEGESNSAHYVPSSGYQTEHGKPLKGVVRLGGLVPPLTLDATSLIAPEFVLLPNIPPLQNPHKRANNFIRLG